MDLTNQNSLDFSYEYLKSHADSCVTSLLNQIKADLQSIDQHISDDNKSSLKNSWDEICAQRQGEEFYSWKFYEMTIESVIEGCFDALSHQDQLCVSFAATQASNNINEPEYDYVYTDEVNAFLYEKVLQLALSDTNPRVQAFLGPYSQGYEDEQRNLDEYLLLRIDPGRRSDFLAALDLFGFVKNIEIDEQAAPLFFELLDNLDLHNN